VSETEVEAGQIGVGIELPFEVLLIAVGCALNVGEWSGIGAVVLGDPWCAAVGACAIGIRVGEDDCEEN
jgi:hypothetical protein